MITGRRSAFGKAAKYSASLAQVFLPQTWQSPQ